MATGPAKILGLEYDAIGNLLKQHDTVAAQTLTGTFGQANRLTAWNGVTYTYDRDGNDTTRTAIGNTTYFTFSADNRLDRVRMGSDTVLYDYNALGQLVRRRRNSKVERLYFWSRDQLIAELDSVAAKRIAEYVYWPGVDRPAALITGHTSVDSVRYYAQDELGNVTGVFGGGAIHQSLDYDPWGLASVTGSLGDTSRVRWKGTLWEGGNTNLYYMRNRWYDPAKRRFITEDPMDVAAGMNPYAFGEADPVNNADPYGLAPCSWWLILQQTHETVTIDGRDWCRDLGIGLLAPVIITGRRDDPPFLSSIPMERPVTFVSVDANGVLGTGPTFEAGFWRSGMERGSFVQLSWAFGWCPGVSVGGGRVVSRAAWENSASISVDGGPVSGDVYLDENGVTGSRLGYGGGIGTCATIPTLSKTVYFSHPYDHHVVRDARRFLSRPCLGGPCLRP